MNNTTSWKSSVLNITTALIFISEAILIVGTLWFSFLVFGPHQNPSDNLGHGIGLVIILFFVTTVEILSVIGWIIGSLSKRTRTIKIFQILTIIFGLISIYAWINGY